MLNSRPVHINTTPVHMQLVCLMNLTRQILRVNFAELDQFAHMQTGQGMHSSPVPYSSR